MYYAYQNHSSFTADKQDHSTKNNSGIITTKDTKVAAKQILQLLPSANITKGNPFI